MKCPKCKKEMEYVKDKKHAFHYECKCGYSVGKKKTTSE